MKVLYSFPHALGRPGIGVTALNQVRGLVAAGAEVTVYCASVAAELPSDVRVVTTMTIGKQRIPQRVLGTDRSYRYHDLRAAAALRLGRFDVVHTWPLGGLRTLLTARRRGTPGFREVPNTHTADAYEQGQREMELCGVEPSKGYSHRPNPRRLAWEEREYQTGLLLTPSDHVADTFLARGFAETALRRHQYGYDPQRFHAAPERRDQAFHAAFVGRCEPRKGLHYALRAWRDSGAGAQGGRFTVAGSFVPGYRDALGSLAEQPGVEFLDFVDDVPSLLAANDVLLLPSVEEGSALVTYEAAGSGCVPLVSDAAGAHIAHDVSGLIHPARAVEALTAQLSTVVGDPATLARLRRGVLQAAPRLTWTAAGDRLLAIYRDDRAHAPVGGSPRPRRR